MDAIILIGTAFVLIAGLLLILNIVGKKRENVDEKLEWGDLLAHKHNKDEILWKGSKPTIKISETELPDFGTGIGMISESAMKHYMQGKDKVDANEHKSAIESFTEAINLSRGFAYAYNSRGISHLAIGQKEKARLDFAKAIELGHHVEESWLVQCK